MTSPSIPQFNPFTTTSPFKFNEVYRDDQSNEANLYLQIFSEFTYQYGTDVVYIERDLKKAEEIFGEYLYQKITNGTPMRLFLEETSGWGGMGEMFSKFGMASFDDATFFCPKILFEQARAGMFPRIGDLIFMPKSKKLFEIRHVEDELPPAFYFLGNRNGFKITAKTYSYDHTSIDQTNNTIPEEVLKLDKIFNIESDPRVEVNLHDLEIQRNNVPIEQEAASGILDNTEMDPLRK